MPDRCLRSIQGYLKQPLLASLGLIYDNGDNLDKYLPNKPVFFITGYQTHPYSDNRWLYGT